MRRSVRISERQLQLRYSLPDSDDSENEADEGAVEELLELSDCEDNLDYDDGDGIYSDDEANMSDDCSEIDQPVLCDKSAGTSNEAESSWGCDTEYFDKLTLANRKKIFLKRFSTMMFFQELMKKQIVTPSKTILKTGST